MGTDEIIGKTGNYIRNVFLQEGSGHDWWHIHRVRQLALFIAEKEGADLFVVEMAALLHDLDDWKLSGENNMQSEKARAWMQGLNMDSTLTERMEASL